MEWKCLKWRHKRPTLALVSASLASVQLGNWSVRAGSASAWNQWSAKRGAAATFIDLMRLRAACGCCMLDLIITLEHTGRPIPVISLRGLERELLAGFGLAVYLGLAKWDWKPFGPHNCVQLLLAFGNGANCVQWCVRVCACVCVCVSEYVENMITWPKPIRRKSCDDSAKMAQTCRQPLPFPLTAHTIWHKKKPQA